MPKTLMKNTISYIKHIIVEFFSLDTLLILKWNCTLMIRV